MLLGQRLLGTLKEKNRKKKKHMGDRCFVLCTKFDKSVKTLKTSRYLMKNAGSRDRFWGAGAGFWSGPCLYTGRT